MKRIISLMLAAAFLFTSCGKEAEDTTTNEIITSSPVSSSLQTSSDAVPANVTIDLSNQKSAEELGFMSLNDPNLLQYINDAVYSDLEQNFANEDYIIDSVSCVYQSKEYLENLAYNSMENVYFGFTLSELEEQFEGKKYIFTVNEAGETTVKEFEKYDDTYEKVVRNVAIGAGVILICVTVSMATGGTASVILAASAKTATSFALSSGAISGISTALITGIETRDFDKTLKEASLKASEGFMWGAITGAVVGGTSEAYKIKTAASSLNGVVPTPRESELYALEKYTGTEQVTFLNGQEVPYGTPGATRPDVVRTVGGKLEAIEVKNYNLETNVNNLCSELRRQISQRTTDLPAGSLQRIALDTRGRGYSAEIIESVKNAIQTTLADVYPNIPIDVFV